MNESRLRELIARYEAAETSLAEERELRGLLAAPELPRDLHGYRAYLGVTRVLAKAEAAPRPGPWERGRATEPAPGLRVAHRPRVGPWKYAAVAAVLLVSTLALLLTYRSYNSTQAPALLAQELPTTVDWSRYEITDPAEATRITTEALAMVGEGLNEGSGITGREVSRIQPISRITSN